MFSRQLVALAVFTGSVFAACSREYTVKAGDYCDKISAENKVSTYQIATLNRDKINSGCTNLQIGQTLCLAGDEKEDCRKVHTVRSGDTCTKISSAGGFNNTILYLNNPQIDEGCTNIYLGEVLCVSNTVQVPPSNGAVIGNPTDGPISVVSTPTPIASPPAPTAGLVDNKTPVDDGESEQVPFCDEVDDPSEYEHVQ